MSQPKSKNSVGLGLLLKLAAAELLQMKSLVFLLIINLAVGLSGYLTLSTFQDALKGALRENAKGFLSADATMSVRRIFTEDELKKFDQVLEESGAGSAVKSRQWEFFSMVAGGEESRLVQVKAVDGSYPLYGELLLESGGKVDGASGPRLGDEFKAWVYPELLLQLGLKLGDNIELGGQKFVLADAVLEDSTQTFRMASLAPKIYVSRTAIAKTNLVQFGTTLSDILMIKIPPANQSPNQPADQSVELLAGVGEKLLTEIKDPAVQWTTYLEASEDTGRFMGYLFDYLGLGSLVGVSLAAFGLAALLRSWLGQKVKIYAIYNSLGISAASVRSIFLVQILLISLGTAVISALLVSSGLPALTAVLSEFVTIPVGISLQTETLIKAALLICLGSIGVTLPFLSEIKDIPTQRLFAEGGSFSSSFRLKSVLLWLPVLFGFWGLAVRESSSYFLGSVFVGALLASYAVLAFVGWLIFRFLSRQGRVWWVRQGLLYLGRKPALLTTFVALSLGAMLTALVPQIKAGLYREIASDEGSAGTRPSLFFFDIQDDQIGPFQDFVKAEGHSLGHISPMIRSRILTVNGESFERVERSGGFQTREEEAEARFRNRGVNLSYRNELSKSERLVDGRPLSPTLRDDGVMELSVEKRYAGRMGLKIGDKVLFDIQGIEMTGEVVNLREVKWNTFQPNFFVLVQPGMLSEAPKIWLADLAGLSAPEKSRMQTAVAKKFTNVSAVDIERTIEKAMEVADKMLFALQLMSVLTWASGFLVLLSILYRQLTTQQKDAVLFRLLGASSRSVFYVFQVEFAVLVLLASVFGSALAVLLSVVTSMWFFDGIFAIDLWSLAFGVLSLSIAAVFFTSLFSLRLSKSNPAGVLQELRL